MKNAFSIDLEDWYQGIELPFSDWQHYEERIEKGTDKVLELLDKHQTKGTFFILGWVAEKYPELVKKIAKEGHEMASHGYSHEKVYDLSPEAFRAEIRRTKKEIEDLSGKEVIAYRAPFFSITSKSLWALEILQEEGYQIDCSISPVKTWRYGISGCPNEIFKIKELDLVEFPVSAFNMLGRKWAIGGAYFRLFPVSLTKHFLSKRQKKADFTMFYIHPWEYDPEHPVVEMEKKAKFTHYINLKKTYNNSDQLLKKYSFDTVANIVANYKAEHVLKEYSLEDLQS